MLPELKNKKLVVGVSGGPDSVYLLDILAKEKAQIIVAHLNHGIRGKDSDADQKFVEQLAKKYHYLFESQKISLSKNFTEEKAREVRYKFLRAMKKKHKADLIVLGHTLDDNIETVFLNLIRGSGLKGLCGIQPLQKDLVRPLLQTSKAEILAYLKQHKLPYRIDKTNKDLKYSRNFLRHKILPDLIKLNPNLQQTINRNLSHFNEIQAFLSQKARNLIKKNLRQNRYPLASFQHLHPALQKIVILEIFQHFNQTKKDISAKHLTEILEIIIKGQGKKHKTFQNVRIEILSKSIVFSKVR